MNAHFIEIKGPELEQKWVGITEESWRAKFEEAKKNKPCVIFVDEGDSQAGTRGELEGLKHSNSVTNQILTLLSDLEKNKNGEYDGVFFILATNKKKLLDPAVLRSGRLSRHIEVTWPKTVKEYLDILKIHTKNKRLDPDFNLEQFASELHGYGDNQSSIVGADIAEIVKTANEHALERSGIFEQMENETLDESAKVNLSISAADFKAAFNSFVKQRHVEEISPLYIVPKT